MSRLIYSKLAISIIALFLIGFFVVVFCKDLTIYGKEKESVVEITEKGIYMQTAVMCFSTCIYSFLHKIMLCCRYKILNCQCGQIGISIVQLQVGIRNYRY